MMALAQSVWSLLIAGLAAYTDLRVHRIKNWVVLSGLAGGLLLHAGSLRTALAGCLFPLILFPFFLLHMMGAGDVKLLCALGAAVGFPAIVPLMLWGFVFCGIHIAADALLRRGMRRLLHDIWQDMRYLFLAHHFPRASTGRRLPMAGSIAAAALLTALLRLSNL